MHSANIETAVGLSRKRGRPPGTKGQPRPGARPVGRPPLTGDEAAERDTRRREYQREWARRKRAAQFKHVD